MSQHLLELKIISATFLVDLDTFKDQDPYIWFKFAGTEYQTSVKNDAGKAAEWNETFKLQYEGESAELQLFAYDKDMIGSDFIGSSELIQLNKYPDGYTTEAVKLCGAAGEETGTLNIKMNRLVKGKKKADKGADAEEEK